MTLFESIKNCTNCELYKLMPDGCKPVHGIGPINAKIMLVGEALGHDESIMEEPFVGQCGQLLDIIIKQVGLVREKLFITNSVKCRPTDTGKKNRPPTNNEIISCYKWLIEEIKLVKPEYIISLGAVATNNLLHKRIKMQDVVGKSFSHTIGDPPHIQNGQTITSTIFPAYHPSFLLQYGKKYLETTTEVFRKVKELSGI